MLNDKYFEVANNKKQQEVKAVEIDQYWKTEHIWRLGRWILGVLVIVLWGAPIEVYGAYILLGAYEQFHGKICILIEKMLHFNIRHKDWE